MKKLLLVAMLVMGFTAVTTAQTNEQAIGVRLGWGGELSYQHPLSGNNRLEVDFGLEGFRHGNFWVTGLYQWLFAEKGGFNLYAGVGPQLGSYYKEDKGYAFGLGVAGQFGGEYNFDEVPVQISLDWRPSLGIVPNFGGFGYSGVALGVRYRF